MKAAAVMVVALATLPQAQVVARAVQARTWAKAARTSSRSEEQVAVKGEQHPVAVRMVLDSLADQRWPCVAGQTFEFTCTAAP
jgi:hypothetical protein